MVVSLLIIAYSSAIRLHIYFTIARASHKEINSTSYVDGIAQVFLHFSHAKVHPNCKHGQYGIDSLQTASTSNRDFQ